MTNRLPLMAAVLCVSLTGVLICQPAFALQSTGSLTYDGVSGATDGLIVSGWNSVSIAWDITMSGPRTYDYQYTLTTGGTPKANGQGVQASLFSHLIFETTSANPPVTLPELEHPQWLSPTGWVDFTIKEVAWAKEPPTGPNPGLPESFYGAKIDRPTGVPDTVPTVFTWRFSTTRVPVWGDFYTKDGTALGTDVYAYNKGFGAPDVDPSPNAVTYGVWGANPLVNDSYHIVRPDGGHGGGWTFQDPNATPELSTWALLACTALGGVGFIKRRKQ